MSLDQKKATLRTELRGRTRLPVPPAVSAAVQERLLSSDLVAGVRIAALYRALPSESSTALLARGLAALRVMLILESSLVAEVPVGEHDERLDALCTEERLILCPPRLG